jgi:hypothetical protein
LSAPGPFRSRAPAFLPQTRRRRNQPDRFDALDSEAGMV